MKMTDFLEKLESFLRSKNKYAASTIKTYLSKIKKLLESANSVDDLCGNVDQLIEDYSKLGSKYDSKDHGTTKAALAQLRDMIKGELVASLKISYSVGSSVYSNKGEYVKSYTIEDEKIVFYVNNKTKPVTKRIRPVVTGGIIDILQTAERKGFLGDISLLYSEKRLLTDAPSSESYKYNLGDIEGECSGSMFGEGKEPERKRLEKRYNDLISQLVYPYKFY